MPTCIENVPNQNNEQVIRLLTPIVVEYVIEVAPRSGVFVLLFST